MDGFWIDRAPVTNREFGTFAEETGYVTFAERSSECPAGVPPGSGVFRRPDTRVPLTNETAWWEYAPGASWRHPEGPGSSIEDRELHPVVHVAHEDAVAYASWAGKALPSEAEWEVAARGGLNGRAYAWGDSLNPSGTWLANTWQGEFPYYDSGEDGFTGTSPVGAFAPNGYDLVDMIGNVWEWTDSAPDRSHAGRGCCGSVAGHEAVPGSNRRIIKGGSYLCAPNFCARYRPAARQALDADSTTCHIGFRCVVHP